MSRSSPAGVWGTETPVHGPMRYSSAMTSENPYRAPGAASLEASELPASKRTELFFEATLRNGRVEVQYRTAYYVSQYAVILGVVLIWTQVAGLVLTGVSLMVVPTLREHGLSEKFG